MTFTLRPIPNEVYNDGSVRAVRLEDRALVDVLYNDARTIASVCIFEGKGDDARRELCRRVGVGAEEMIAPAFEALNGR